MKINFPIINTYKNFLSIYSREIYLHINKMEILKSIINITLSLNINNFFWNN